MMGLSDGAKNFQIRLVVLIQYRLWRTASHPASHVAVAITLYAKASSLKTGSIEIVKQSQEYFDFEIPSVDCGPSGLANSRANWQTLTTYFVNIWYNWACLLMILCHSVMLVLFIMFVYYVCLLLPLSATTATTMNKDEYMHRQTETDRQKLSDNLRLSWIINFSFFACIVYK